MGIIIKPIISEKMTAITEKFPERYGFRVSSKANKIEIKNAVEKMYDVKVIAVNTARVTPKLKVRYTKSGIQKGRAAAFKKAIVTLEKGQTINFFDNI